jgi:hypothetical protein
MIRFACPGCASVYDVDDVKAGKTGMCPKCRAKFTIPHPKPATEPPPPEPIQPAASPPPPDQAVPPPPVVSVPEPAPEQPPAPIEQFDFEMPGMSQEAPSSVSPPLPVVPPVIPDAVVVQPPAPVSETVEINPCPHCGSRASVYLEDLGTEIECPQCRRVFPAMRLGSIVAVSPPPYSSRYRDDDDDDRRDRRSRRRSRYDDDEEEDDDERAPRRKKSRSGRKRDQSNNVKTMRIISGILCVVIGVLDVLSAIGFICCATFLTSFFIGITSDPRLANNPDADKLSTFGTLFGGLFIACGILLVLKGFVYIMGGAGGLMKKGYGRVLMLICSILSILSVLGYLGWGGTSLVSANPIGILQSLVGFLLCLGQAITGCMSTMGEQARLEYD